MAYFVTGATGFIGRFLVANLLKRGEPIYVLVRKGSTKKLAALREDYWEANERAGDRGRRRSWQDRTSAFRRRRRRRSSKGKIAHFFHLAAIYDLSASAEAQQAANVERHAPRGRFRCGGRRRLLPPCELDRRRRSLRRRLSRGHVRGGRGSRPSVFQDQARFRGRRPQALQAAVPDLPAGLRRRRLEDRLHRQDRRAVLFLQGPAEDARRAAAVDADDRHRRRPHQHRARRFRRRRARLSRAQERPRRQVLPPDRSGAAPDRRSAQHLRAARATRRR